MLTLPQNGRNCAPRSWNVKIFWGRILPDPPTSWPPFIEPLMLKTWICPRNTQIFPVKVLELEPCVYEPLWYRLANPSKGKKCEILNLEKCRAGKSSEQWVKSHEMSQISYRGNFQQGLWVLEFTYHIKAAAVNIMINFTI